MKLCKDCIFCDGPLDYPNCTHPDVIKRGEVDVVTGERDDTWCRAERFSGPCGPDAKLFATSVTIEH